MRKRLFSLAKCFFNATSFVCSPNLLALLCDCDVVSVFCPRWVILKGLPWPCPCICSSRCGQGQTGATDLRSLKCAKFQMRAFLNFDDWVSLCSISGFHFWCWNQWKVLKKHQKKSRTVSSFSFEKKNATLSSSGSLILTNYQDGTGTNGY